MWAYQMSLLLNKNLENFGLFLRVKDSIIILSLFQNNLSLFLGRKKEGRHRHVELPFKEELEVGISIKTTLKEMVL